MCGEVEDWSVVEIKVMVSKNWEVEDLSRGHKLASLGDWEVDRQWWESVEEGFVGPGDGGGIVEGCDCAEGNSSLADG